MVDKIDYCTQADVERYLNVTFTENPDATVTAFIERISARIDDICNRDFDNHADHVEYHDGHGQGNNSFLLKNYPVTAVASVKEDGTTLTETTHFVWYEDGRVVRVSSGYEDPSTTYWLKKLKAIEVTYTYGFSAVPKGINDICTRWVCEGLKQQPFRFEEGGIADSVSLEGVSVNYGEIDHIPEWVPKALMPYKKLLVA